eukprot:TRINITY_DN1714_c2_g2_i1.p8 TRINITY_DN1714_c2_g2~~TRINITY_DN1714_c2_g2_i1.p8  ORF type:complete len:102 (-),score=6.42 TRINITY_DN1714_c2_g2_i1:1048-1353(-)
MFPTKFVVPKLLFVPYERVSSEFFEDNTILLPQKLFTQVNFFHPLYIEIAIRPQDIEVGLQCLQIDEILCSTYHQRFRGAQREFPFPPLPFFVQKIIKMLR